MKYENETFQDLMGLVIETDNEWLHKKLNGHLCYKGGGSTTTTTTSNELPKEFRPFASQYAGALQRDFNKFGQVGDEAQALKQAQQAALGRAGSIQDIGQAGLQAQQEALSGQGLFAAQDLSGQKEALAAQAREQLGLGTVQRQAGAMGTGTFGSARNQLAQQRAQEAGMADLASNFAELDAAELQRRRAASAAARGETGVMQKAQMADIDIMRGVGKEQTARSQFEAEAPVRGLKEIGSIFTGLPMNQTAVQSGGGGGK